ncbi:MAG TPA: DUF6701 domain-containing protein, partial [Burkholderiales bacterium]|nr:DUF6701 domain-containing protein [Burkholderiales bacterium]
GGQDITAGANGLAGVGRFIPNHFDVVLTHGCVAGTFTYSGRPFSATVAAYNGLAIPGITTNFAGALGFSKDVTLSNAGASNPGTFTSGGTFQAADFAGGTRTQDVAYTFSVKETVPLAGADGLTLRASSTEQALPSVVVTSSGHIEQSTEVRSGRIAIQNAYGSELLDLFMPMRVQYYAAGNTGWVTNTLDECTAVTMSAFSNPQGNLAVAETCIQDIGSPGRSGSAPTACAAVGPIAEQFREGGVAGFSGDFNLYLRAPGTGNDGSVDVSLDLSPAGLNMPWLRYDWDGVAGDNEPQGRATFGIFKGNRRHIYLRERY